MRAESDSHPSTPPRGLSDAKHHRGPGWHDAGGPATGRPRWPTGHGSTPLSDDPGRQFLACKGRLFPTLEPVTPSGDGLRGFPGAEDPGDPLRLRPGLRSKNGKTVTWSDSDDPMRWVRIEGGWQTESEYSAVETLQVGPFTWATAGLLRQRVPEEVLLELTSTDDHAALRQHRHLHPHRVHRWNRLPGVFSGRKATVNDLTTNERRVSVRQGWLDHPTNTPDSGVIDSPRGPSVHP